MSEPISQDRRDDAAVLMLMTEMHKDVRDLTKKLEVHMTEETHDLAAEVSKLMSEAFPEGDPKGHRRHHELVIRQAEKRAAFWTDMAASVSKWGLIGFLGWMLFTLWKAFLLGPKS